MPNISSLLTKVLFPAAGRTWRIRGVGFLIGWGPDLPDAQEGWAPRALFFHLAATGVSLHMNTGTSGSCTFEPVGALTAFGAMVGAAGKILVGDGNSFEEVAISGDATLASTGALTVTHKLDRAIADPGDGGAIPVTTSGQCALVTGAAAETRTLDAPTFVNQVLTLSLKTDGGGDVTISVACPIDQDGHNTIDMGDAGAYITLIGVQVGAARRWAVLGTPDSCTLSTV